MDWQPLVAAAGAAREHAHAPYSRYRVGAALLAESGRIYAGCNVENRSYGLTVCAERVALGTAVAAGERVFRAAVVVTQSMPPAPPCGMCREALTEFCPDLPLLLVSVSGERREVRLRELLPSPFVFAAPDPAA